MEKFQLTMHEDGVVASTSHVDDTVKSSLNAEGAMLLIHVPPTSSSSSTIITSDKLGRNCGINCVMDGGVESSVACLAAGTILGPFPVRRTAAEDLDELKVMLNDSSGNCHSFTLMDLDAVNVLKRIQTATSERLSNCYAFLIGDSKLFLVVTKTVERIADLIVNFSDALNDTRSTNGSCDSRGPCSAFSAEITRQLTFPCAHCTICFSHPETLRKHQSFYCNKCVHPANNETGSTSTIDKNAACLTASHKRSLTEFDSSISNLKDCLPLPSVGLTSKGLESFDYSDSKSASLDSNSVQPDSERFTMRDVNEFDFYLPIKTGLPSRNSLQPNEPILLPVAYHNNEDESLVQVIGRPQIVIPVAVHQRADKFNHEIRPFIVDQTSNVTISQCIIPVVSTTPTSGQSSLCCRKAPCSSGRTSILSKAMDYSGEDHPLDLSKKSPINISSLNPLSGSISSSLSMTPIYDKPLKRRRVHIVEKLNETESNRCEPQKRLLCDCGVSFVAEETLNGHKKYYCRNRTHNEEEFPKELQQSDHSLTSQYHLKALNSQLHSYICTLCGYKGYSQRGMKSHLRISHTAYELQHRRGEEGGGGVSPLMNLVLPVLTSDSAQTLLKKKFSCQKCFCIFSTQNKFLTHNCMLKNQNNNSLLV